MGSLHVHVSSARPEDSGDIVILAVRSPETWCSPEAEDPDACPITVMAGSELVTSLLLVYFLHDGFC